MKNLLVLVLLVATKSAALKNTEQRLIENLFKGYNKQSRPVRYANQTIDTTFGIELIQLIKVSDREQYIVTKCWVRQAWKNELLKWNPDDYDGLKTFQVDANMLWLPDMVLYNNADEEFPGGTEKYKTRVNLSPDGTNSWLAPATFSSTCSIDIRYFPFDKQICKFKFGSWTYDKNSINLLKDQRPIITNQFVKSAEWEVTKSVVQVNEVKYLCCEAPFMDTTFSITLVRKPLYYVFNVILPCVVLVVTILFGFFLPPESGERISLTITILLAVAVFLQLISDTLPRNSDSIPVLGIFYMVVMAESAFSLVTTCIVLVIHHRSNDVGAIQIPKWARELFLKKAAKLLGVRVTFFEQPNLRKTEAYLNNKNNIDGFDTQNLKNSDLAKSYDNNGYIEQFDHRNLEKTMSNKIKLRNTPSDNNSALDAIFNEVQVITSTIQHKNRNEEIGEEWRSLARVLDRLFFWLFLMTVILSSICILVPAYLVNH